MRLACETIANAWNAAASLARNPITNLDWGMELAAKAAWVAERRLHGERATVMQRSGDVASMARTP
jgi:hypothetical protein